MDGNIVGSELCIVLRASGEMRLLLGEQCTFELSL
jgi:hypothetical protein